LVVWLETVTELLESPTARKPPRARRLRTRCARPSAVLAGSRSTTARPLSVPPCGSSD